MDDIPVWVIERVCDLATIVLRERYPTGRTLPGSLDVRNEVATAFARYIAEHEEPPVDPLLIEAEQIVDKYDYTFNGLRNAVAEALRRGIELGKQS